MRARPLEWDYELLNPPRHPAAGSPQFRQRAKRNVARVEEARRGPRPDHSLSANPSRQNSDATNKALATRDDRSNKSEARGRPTHPSSAKRLRSTSAPLRAGSTDDIVAHQGAKRPLRPEGGAPLVPELHSRAVPLAVSSDQQRGSGASPPDPTASRFPDDPTLAIGANNFHYPPPHSEYPPFSQYHAVPYTFPPFPYGASNYSNPSIYESFPAAAGLTVPTPFHSPTMHMGGSPFNVPGAHNFFQPMQSPATRCLDGAMAFPRHVPLPGTAPFPTSSPATALVPVIPPSAMHSPAQPKDAKPTSTGLMRTSTLEAYSGSEDVTAQWPANLEEFPLKVFREHDARTVQIGSTWDDETLLRELGKAYDDLRGPARRWLSVKGVWWVSCAQISVDFEYRVLIANGVVRGRTRRYLTIVRVRHAQFDIHAVGRVC